MENPNTYKHSGFPRGCDLSDQLLRKDLERVFNRVADKSDKLAHYGSSQAKESLNCIIVIEVGTLRWYILNTQIIIFLKNCVERSTYYIIKYQIELSR